MDFELRPRTVLLTLAGSRAYGLHTADSDLDLKGVAIATAPYYHGCLRHFEQADRPTHMAAFLADLHAHERAVAEATKLEGTVYEVRKFLNLALEANPNILDVLFCRDDEVRLLTPAGARMRAARDLFLSARCKHTFSGYAAAQLKRIRGHRRWLLDPPKAPPRRADYGLPDQTLIPADQLAAAAEAVKKRMDAWCIDYGTLGEAEKIAIEAQIATALTEIGLGNDEARWVAAARHVGIDDNLMLVMQRERTYESAARDWRQYQEWRRNRNPARAALEERYGYDCKHGAHLVRLLRMGREILTTGQVHVWRGGIDADELLAIRQGAWTYDRLVSWAEAEDDALEKLYRTGPVAVPKQPDRTAVDQLCVDLVEEALRAS